MLVGVETQPLGSELQHVTFYEEGGRRMLRELSQVWRHFERLPNFQGFTVHDYAGMRLMEQREGGRQLVR